MKKRQFKKDAINKDVSMNSEKHNTEYNQPVLI